MSSAYYPIKLKLYTSTTGTTLASSMEYNGSSQTLLKGADAGSGKLVLDSTTVFLGDNTGLPLKDRLVAVESATSGISTTYATRTHVNLALTDVSTGLDGLRDRIVAIENVIVNHLDTLSVGSTTDFAIALPLLTP